MADNAIHSLKLLIPSKVVNIMKHQYMSLRQWTVHKNMTLNTKHKLRKQLRKLEIVIKMVLVSGITSNIRLPVTLKTQEVHAAVICCDSAFDSNLAYMGKNTSCHHLTGEEFCSYYVCCGHENKGEVKYHTN